MSETQARVLFGSACDTHGPIANVRRALMCCGIDVGSTTAKVVFLDADHKVVFQDYQRHDVRVRQTLARILHRAAERLGDPLLTVHVTGSAGLGMAEGLSLPFIQEVVAATEAVRGAWSGVGAMVDIGGEDSKLVLLDEAGRADIRMNGSCAGGTGAFIDQMASLLDCPVEEFDGLASQATSTPSLASRCGVFARTDVQTLLAQGVPRADIARGVFQAVAQQVLTSLARGARLRPKVLFAGGPLAFMPGLRQAVQEAFRVELEDVIIPDYAELVPARGAALTEGTEHVRLSDLLARVNDPIVCATATDLRDPPFFAHEAERDEWMAARFSAVERVDLTCLHERPVFLGIDSGSTSTKMVLVDEEGRLAFEHYAYSRGDHVAAVARGLQELSSKLKAAKSRPRILGSTATGYGEGLVRTVFNLHSGVVETLAHLRAARHFEPRVDFVLDIGGQDMKALFVKGDAVAHIEINEACSSGCGAFLQSFAEVLGQRVEDFALAATRAAAPCNLGSRCTVFMNSKVKQSLREGAAVNDIAAGLSYSVVRNCLHKVLKIRDPKVLGQHIVVQGGTFLNPAIQRAFEMLVDRPVTCPDVAGLAGALGAALTARDRWAEHQEAADILDLDRLAHPGPAVRKQIKCRGCTNHCPVTRLRYGTGKPYYAGNRCERIFGGNEERASYGTDLLAEQRARLEALPSDATTPVIGTVGLPMALNLWDDLPFWTHLLTGCGLNAVRSRPSSPELLARGAGTVMSDSICFPAKLAHGHVLDLVEQGVDRVLYPRVVHGEREHEADNSFNCPIVTGYPDVIRASVDLGGVPLDTPTITLRDAALLKRSCWRYLRSLGVPRKRFLRAFGGAQRARAKHREALLRRTDEVMRLAASGEQETVLLVGRPYHLDTLVNHGVPSMLADLGVNVLFSDGVPDNGRLDDVHALAQWAFPNRLYNAVRWAASQSHVHVLQLNSFGCGPDAIVIDELRALLTAHGKPFTVLRVDEVSSPGSLRLRCRTLVQTLRAGIPDTIPQPRRRPPAFQEDDRSRLVLVPCMHGGLTPFIEAEFASLGYRVEVVPPADARSRELGLRHVNNEICYPAILVIGDILHALSSGRYDLDHVAVGIPQTGGQCRASSYLSMLEKALLSSGFDQVPVVSVLPTGEHLHDQPGWKPNRRQFLISGFYGLVFDDVVTMLEYALAAREHERGSAALIAERHRNAFLSTLPPSRRSTMAAIEAAARDFATIPARQQTPPRIGLVGEIYAKYGAFANHRVIEWMATQRVEVVMAQLSTFFTQELLNPSINKKAGICRADLSWVVTQPLMVLADRFVKEVNQCLEGHPLSRPLHTPRDLARLAEPVLDLVNQYGEGWLIAAETRAMAQQGLQEVLCLQPFGCIANQVVAKGVERRLRQLHPQLRILFADLDPDTSPANLFNRLHFLVQGARESARTSVLFPVASC